MHRWLYTRRSMIGVIRMRAHSSLKHTHTFVSVDNNFNVRNIGDITRHTLSQTHAAAPIRWEFLCRAHGRHNRLIMPIKYMSIWETQRTRRRVSVCSAHADRDWGGGVQAVIAHRFNVNNICVVTKLELSSSRKACACE